MKELKGLIEWIDNAPKENKYSRSEDDKYQIGIKLQGNFYNYHFATEEEANIVLSELNRGYEIKIEYGEYNKILALEILSKEIQEIKSTLKEQLEKVNYKTLMDKAHSMGLINTDVRIVPELTDISKKMACFRAEVTLKRGDKTKVFSDYGEACGLEPSQGGNIDQPTIKNAYIRMASTRALVRALRQATNNMEVAEEELPEAKLN